MVTKKGTKKAKKSRVKVGKLQINKETVEDLTDKEAKEVKGGATGGCADTGVAIVRATVAGANCG